MRQEEARAVVPPTMTSAILPSLARSPSKNGLRGEIRELVRLAIPIAGAQLALMTMGLVDMAILGRAGKVQLAGAGVTCPCIWKTEGKDARPLSIPKYNNENRWYIEKYQSIVGLFEVGDRTEDSARTN